MEKEGGIDVLLKGEDPIHADMGILAIGVAPDAKLAGEAGIKLGIKGSIVVNERMEISIPDIYAVGDAVQIKNAVSGEEDLISWQALRTNRDALPLTIFVVETVLIRGAQGSSVIKVFDMTAATTGLNEKRAKKLGIDTDKVILSPMSHAGYYPGGKVMTRRYFLKKRPIVCWELRSWDMRG